MIQFSAHTHTDEICFDRCIAHTHTQTYTYIQFPANSMVSIAVIEMDGRLSPNSSHFPSEFSTSITQFSLSICLVTRSEHVRRLILHHIIQPIAIAVPVLHPLLNADNFFKIQKSLFMASLLHWWMARLADKCFIVQERECVSVCVCAFAGPEPEVTLRRHTDPYTIITFEAILLVLLQSAFSVQQKIQRKWKASSKKTNRFRSSSQKTLNTHPP